MSLEKLSVEIEDNSAAVATNIDRLAVVIDKLSKKIDTLSTTSRQHAGVQDTVSRSSQSFAAHIVRIGTSVVKIGGLIVASTAAIATGVTVLKAFGVDIAKLGGLLSKDLPIIGFFIKAFDLLGAAFIKTRFAITGALVAFLGFVKLPFDATPGFRKLQNMITAFRFALGGTSAVAANVLGVAKRSTSALDEVGAGAQKAADSLGELGEATASTIPPAEKAKAAYDGMSSSTAGVTIVVSVLVRMIATFAQRLGVVFVRSAIAAANAAGALSRRLAFLQVAVGGNAAALEEFRTFARQTAAALGITSESMLEAIGLTLQYTRAMGLSHAQVKQFLLRVVDVSSALGEDLMVMLQDVITGTATYSRRLKMLGIDLSEEQLIAEGYIKAKEKDASVTDLQAHAQARMNAFLAKTTTFVGTAEIRAKTFAGSLVRLRNAQSDLNETLGEGAQFFLLPFYKLVTNVSTAIATLPSELIRAIGAFQGFAGVALTLLGGLVKAATTLAIVRSSWALLSNVVAGASKVLTQTVSAATDTSESIVKLAASGRDAAAVFTVLTGAIKQLLTSGFVFLGSVATTVKEKLLAVSAVGIGSLIKFIGIAISRFGSYAIKLAPWVLVILGAVKAIGYLGSAFDRISASLNKTGKAVAGSTGVWNDLLKILTRAVGLIGVTLSKAVLTLYFAVQGLIAPLMLLTDAIGMTEDAFDNQMVKLEATRKELFNLQPYVDVLTDKEAAAEEATTKHTQALTALDMAMARSAIIAQQLSRGLYSDVQVNIRLGEIRQELYEIDRKKAIQDEKLLKSIQASKQAYTQLRAAQELLLVKQANLIVYGVELDEVDQKRLKTMDQQLKAYNDRAIALETHRLQLKADDETTQKLREEQDKLLDISRKHTDALTDATEKLRIAQAKAAYTYSEATELQLRHKKALEALGKELDGLPTATWKLGESTKLAAAAIAASTKPISTRVYELLDQIAQIEEEAAGIVDPFKQFFIDMGQSLTQSLQSSMGDALYALSQGAANMRDIFDSLLDDILKQLSQFAARALTQQVLGNLLNILGSAVNAPALGTQLTGVATAATGGIVTKPTLSLIGEKGPEAIIPLRDLNKMSPQPIAITVLNLTGRPEDVVARGISAQPNLVINPVLQDARMGGKISRFFAGT